MTESDYESATDAVKKAGLAGIQFDKIPGRIYPENALASQLIGFMGDDGKGLSGIEYALQDYLAPKRSTDPGSDASGSDVYLTIDAALQYKLERIVRSALQETGGESIMLLAADSTNGEILSYISLPAANLNEYPSATPVERLNRPAVSAFEPGSVFKVFSVASFLEAGVINENDLFVCDGSYDAVTRAGERITIKCTGVHGAVTPRRALDMSCNDALCQMSERIEAAAFISKLKEFGFGSRTGVELSGETRGSLKSPGDILWSLRSKPTISIGQEVGVSALQIVQATSAFTNGGVPVKLTLVSKINGKNGASLYEHESALLPRVISEKTAAELLSYMESGAERGIGVRALLGDVTIGVKTGTAQMTDPETGLYSETDFLSDCIAIFPVEAPKIILYIVLTKAQTDNVFASRIVAPVIKDAANAIIDHYGWARSNAVSLSHSGTIILPDRPPIMMNNVVPDFRDVPKRLLTPLLERTDVNILMHGDGYVVQQSPPPGTPITENITIELYLE
jgi:cell division protein FtsI (penicillin-binding protein 3)